MDIIDEPQKVVVPTGTIQGKYQSVAALTDLDPLLDDAAVREQIVRAEAAGVDPLSIPLSDLTQAPQAQPMPEGLPPAPEILKQNVPDKFLKPDGEVDVEKIQASTRQLGEVIQKKETAVAKTIDDYMREYREQETKFRNLPNPDRLAAQLQTTPVQAQAPDVSGFSTQQLEEMIRRDYQQDPVMTTTRLIDIAVQKAVEPFKAREQDDNIRSNIAALAARDGRVLEPQNYEAIKAKLAREPDLWKLKNPHKAAWLEVKEELRLGDLPQGSQAQPSTRPLSPVLGGGTPPSAPSSSAPQTPQTVLSNLDRLDLRDRKQEAAGDEAIRAMLTGRR